MCQCNAGENKIDRICWDHHPSNQWAAFIDARGNGRPAMSVQERMLAKALKFVPSHLNSRFIHESIANHRQIVQQKEKGAPNTNMMTTNAGIINALALILVWGKGSLCRRRRGIFVHDLHHHNRLYLYKSENRRTNNHAGFEDISTIQKTSSLALLHGMRIHVKKAKLHLHSRKDLMPNSKTVNLSNRF